MFKKLLLSLTILFSGFVFAQPNIETKMKVTEEKNYTLVNPRDFSLAQKDKIVLVEFFWYGCPHCFQMKPMIEALEKKHGAKIQVIRYPVALGSWGHGAKVFFTLQEAGLLEKYHNDIFIKIQNDRMRVDLQDEFLSYMSSKGEDTTKLKNIMTSFSMSTKLNKAKQLNEAYTVNSTPNYVLHVNGLSYKVDPATVRSYEKTISILDNLINQNIQSK